MARKMGITDTGKMEVPARHFPWLQVLLVALVVLAVVVGGEIIIRLSQTIWENPTLPVSPPQIGIAPVEPTPTVTPTPTPIIKEWPKVEVVWGEPFRMNSLAADLPPSLPAGKGFVRETPNGILDDSASPEAQAYLRKILPQFLPEDTRDWGVWAGVARDPANPNVVLAGFWVSYSSPEIRIGERGGPHYGFLFLSIDGEKSWYEISSFISDPWANQLTDVRVKKERENVVLFVSDPYNLLAGKWRKAVVPLQSLP